MAEKPHEWVNEVGTECRVEEGAKGFWWKMPGGLGWSLQTAPSDLVNEILRLSTALSEAEERARVEGMREAMEAVGHDPWRAYQAIQRRIAVAEREPEGGTDEQG